MVQGEDQDVLRCRELDQQGAKQRACRQVKRLAHGLDSEATDLLLPIRPPLATEIDESEGKDLLRGDELARLTVALAEHGRRAWCRQTIACRLRSRASGARAPVRRNAIGTL